MWMRRALFVALLGAGVAACSDDTVPFYPPADTGVDAADTGDGDVDPDADPDATTDADPGDVDPGDTPDALTDTDGDTTIIPDAIADADPDADPDAQVDTDVFVPPAEWPEEDLILLSIADDNSASYSANFADGWTIDDLSWASTPDVACWDNPAVNDEWFSGQYFAFAVEETIPAWSDVTITLTPPDNGEATLFVINETELQRDIPPAIDTGFCHRPQTFGGVGNDTTYTFRVYEPTNLMFGVSNRGRFPGDDDGDLEVGITVTPIAPAEQCYDEGTAPGQHPPQVTRLTLDDEGSYVGLGQLAEGAPTCGSHEWLDDAFCVPSTQLEHYQGNHRFYAIEGGIPEFSVMTVTVVPDPGVEVSLYGTRQGKGTSFYVPPFFPATLCEASLSHPNRNPGQPESMTFVATTNPYEIFFGVAGDTLQGAEGGYTIKVDLITYATASCTEEEYAAVTGLDEWPSNVEIVDISGGSGSVVVDLADGEPMCGLAWASNSQTACFPATENTMFNGNTLYFAFDPIPPAGSNVYVTVRPDSDVDVSIFGYRLGLTNFMVPPQVPVVGSCEASYSRGVGDTFNPGDPESIEFLNPGPYQYQFFVGVSGSGGATGGRAILDVVVEEDPPPHCPESLPGATYPTWPTSVKLVDVVDGSATGSGNLSDGECTNLGFASRSSVACFPATEFNNFQGNHVRYALDEPLPPNSEMWIRVTPDAGVDVNLWGTQTGVTNFPVAPNINSVVSCEASYPPGAPNPGEMEEIYFANPTGNDYNIAFAVAGNDLTGSSGGYTYEVEIRTGAVHCEESLPGTLGLTDWPSDVELITLNGDNEGTITGDLSDGACTNLTWAADSSVACFPATSFEHFRGSHVYHALEQAIPPRSSLTVVLTPDEGVDANLYGFQLGETNYMVPPAVPSAICEASYPWRTRNPGEPETIRFYNPSASNSYNIFLGVAGADGVDAGGYELFVDLNVTEPHCPESLPGRSYSDWPANVHVIDAPRGATTTDAYNMSGTGCVDLGWAASSQTACFPATQNANFQGSHKFFALDPPLGPGERIRASVPSGDWSIYGYTTGTSSFFVPPFLPTALSCEYDTDNGQIEFTNPTGNTYNFVLGVAGATGVNSGNFDLTVQRLAP